MIFYLTQNMSISITIYYALAQGQKIEERELNRIAKS
jgi:hypothetical protein